MDFFGTYEIPAPPATVWDGLNDPAVLKSCIPGCEEIEKTSPSEFIATATLKIGPVRARFKGKVSLSEQDPPRRCMLSGEGQGGMAGFARGSAEVVLKPTATGTELTYTARANVGGKLAQVGQRLIDGAARQIADDFFARFAGVVGAGAANGNGHSTGEEPSNTGPAALPQVAHADTPRDGVAPEIWVVGLIAVVGVLLLLFSVSL
ncbi:MAG: carbon monoxide dehydrogenase subunit G [Alphaproteobacteria bacterium]|nr:carbon monoxide dehydrogenase subunit G [Alphaproteobacteria bacterium]